MPDNILDKEISQHFLSKCFTYDPETGILTWKSRPIAHFLKTQNWEKHINKQSGKPAGLDYFTAFPKATLKVKLDNYLYSVPAIIWCLVHGSYDENMCNDDGNPWNNKLENLTTKSSVHIPFPLPRKMTITEDGLAVGEHVFNFDDYKTALSFVRQPKRALLLKYCEMENFTEKQTDDLVKIYNL